MCSHVNCLPAFFLHGTVNCVSCTCGSICFKFLMSQSLDVQ